MEKLEAKISVEKLEKFNSMDLEDICDATIDTMKETVGFDIGTQKTKHYQRPNLISYWEGVLLVPERTLIVGRLDGVIAGAAQLVSASPSNQTSSFACLIDNHFVAPWARGHSMSNLLLDFAEEEAKKQNFSIVRLSVRETRKAAISVFEKRGYVRWGVLPEYEIDKGEIVAGYFYYKEL